MPQGPQPGEEHNKCKGPEARKSLVFLMKPGLLGWSELQEEEGDPEEAVAAVLGFVGCAQELRL